MNVFTRLMLFSSLSSVASIGLQTTEAKAFTLTNLQVNAQITSPAQGQVFPNGSIVAGTGIASWAGIISTVDETQPITLFFGYSFQHDNLPSQSGAIPYTFAPGLNLVPVGSRQVNFSDLAGPLSPGTYITSIGASFQGQTDGDAHSWIVSTPEPTSTLSLLALGTLSAASTKGRKLKPSKSSEKETTKFS